MKYLLLLLLCVSCSQPLPTNQRVQTLSEGGGQESCPYEGAGNFLTVNVHWDEFYGWVMSPMVDNATFWGDSAIVLLNQLKHAESTMTCVPAFTFDLATAYSDTLTIPPHQGGFGDQYIIYIDFGGDYMPTASERDSVIRVCDRAIGKIDIIRRDVYARSTAHWYGLSAYDYYFSGGF